MPPKLVIPIFRVTFVLLETSLALKLAIMARKQRFHNTFHQSNYLDIEWLFSVFQKEERSQVFLGRTS